jgi:hypothetical protein
MRLRVPFGDSNSDQYTPQSRMASTITFLCYISGSWGLGEGRFFFAGFAFIYHAGVEQSPEALARHLCLPPVWCSICASYGSEKRFRAVFLRCYAVLCDVAHGGIWFVARFVRRAIPVRTRVRTRRAVFTRCQICFVSKDISSGVCQAQAGHIKVRGSG